MKRLTSGTILFLAVLFCGVGYPQTATVASAPQPAGTKILNIQSAGRKCDSYGQHGPEIR